MQNNEPTADLLDKVKGASTPSSRSRGSAATTPRTGGGPKTPGSRASKASKATPDSQATITPTPLSFSAPSSAAGARTTGGGGGGGGAGSFSGNVSLAKRAHRQISHDGGLEDLYDGDSDYDPVKNGDSSTGPDGDETPTGRKKKQPRKAIDSTTPIGGGYRANPYLATSTAAGLARPNASFTSTTSSSFAPAQYGGGMAASFDAGGSSTQQHQVIDLAGDEDEPAYIKKEPTKAAAATKSPVKKKTADTIVAAVPGTSGADHGDGNGNGFQFPKDVNVSFMMSSSGLYDEDDLPEGEV